MTDVHLALYYYDGCFFCRRVLLVIDELGLDVELRNVLTVPSHRDDLMKARGRSTVPVLRITSPESDRWLAESSDIIAFLRTNFSKPV